MSNLLALPFRKSYTIPIKPAARDYILKSPIHPHPDAYKTDLSRWEALRAEGIGGVVHVDRVDATLLYHAQLVLVLTKLPPDISLEIPFAPVFSPDALPPTFPNLLYERACVVFNLAALFSQLGASEDRRTGEGIKRASHFFQQAAGTLSYLAMVVLPKLMESMSGTGQEVPLDLSEAFVKSAENLMLAQAQECAWQKAVMDNYKSGLLARLAIKTSRYYAAAATRAQEASPSFKRLLPSNWVPHLQAKHSHFEAVAQYRKSLEDSEASRLGHELGRLQVAHINAKAAYDAARRNGVAKAVMNDAKSLLDVLATNLARAERDNDLIYHADVPSAGALANIQEASLVKVVVPPKLEDLQLALGSQPPLFGEMVGWGAQKALDIYDHRRKHWLKDEVYDKVSQLNNKAAEMLHSLNLPASLDALDRPIGLPPSLLKKADEVKQQDGPEQIRVTIEDVRSLARRCNTILDEAMDVLDQEATEDEDLRERDPSTSRPISHVANAHLIENATRYREVMKTSAESDAKVREGWDQWDEEIERLTWSEEKLENWVPSSTGRAASTAQTSQTRARADSLRATLSKLDALTRARTELVSRARRLAEIDDIQSRVAAQAAAFALWVEVQPAMFDEVLDEEMGKYEKFREGVEGSAREQGEVLEEIARKNRAYLDTRRDDPTVKAREYSLQSLDLAYHKYHELVRHLHEGQNFYNSLSVILTDFRGQCTEWARSRQAEIDALTSTMKNVSIQSPPMTNASAPRLPLPPGAGLPHPDSDDWEQMELPAGPPRRGPMPNY